MFKIQSVSLLVIIPLLLSVSGCVSTASKVIKNSDMEISTKMSNTVWLDPVGADKRTAFIQVRNTSDVDIDIESKIASSLTSKGYKVVQDPSKAHYWIQANVLKIGKSDKDETAGLLGAGYGDALVGGAIGSQFGSGSGSLAMATIGVLGAVAVDAFFEDILYTMVTDLQVSESSKKGVVVTENNNQVLAQGTSGAKTQTSSESTDRKKYQTRIVSTASQINLEIVQALPPLERGLVKSISGIL